MTDAPDRRRPSLRRRVGEGRWPVVGVVALGGVAGALARYAIMVAWPAPADGFPWATWVINASGCAAIGVLLTLLTEGFTPHRLLRPLVGTGFLGGFTTFSTYAADTHHLVDAGHPGTGLAYLAATPVIALAGVWTAAATTSRVITRRRR